MEWKISTAPVDYPAALDFMDQRVAKIIDGTTAECVWLLEHPPLYTGGTSARAEDLLQANFPIYETGRGGQYTYHGPGQRVIYAMLNLKNRTPDIRHYVCQLEEWLILTLAEFDVMAERRAGRVGLWVVRSNGREDKIAAIGVRVRRWVTLHGAALNVRPDLSHFNGIVPCGITGHGVTSLQDLGIKVSLAEVDAVLQKTFNNVFSATTDKPA